MEGIVSFPAIRVLHTEWLRMLKHTMQAWKKLLRPTSHARKLRVLNGVIRSAHTAQKSRWNRICRPGSILGTSAAVPVRHAAGHVAGRGKRVDR